MRTTTKFLFALAVAAAAVALNGCGGGDDAPTSPGSGTMTLDSATAEEFSLEALGTVNEIVLAVPDFASGAFDAFSVSGQPVAKAAGDSVTWDPAQQAWVFAYAGPLFEMDPPNEWNLSLDLWVQYRTPAGPQQHPLGATEMQVRYGVGMDIHQEDAEGVFDLVYDTDTDMTAAFLGQDTYAVTGSGSADVSVSQVTPQGSQSGTFGMTWTVDVVTAAGGCPSGTATVRTQAWTLAAEYDGQGGVAWSLTGPNWQSSGSDTLACGQPAS